MSARLDITPMLPWSQESECALLGALLLDCPKAWDKAQPIERRHFFDSRNGAIFAAIESLHIRKIPVDTVTVFEHLRDTDLDEEVGGLPYLNDLTHTAATAYSAGAYAKKVREMAMRRALLESLDKAMELATAPGGEPMAKLDEITTMLGQLQRQQIAKVPRTAREAAIERIAHWQALAEGKALPGWPTYIPRLTEQLNGGLRPGGLYYLAARPGIGKTSFSLEMCLEMAARNGLVTLFLSQEMTEGELVDRATACTARVSYAELQNGRLKQDDWSRIVEAVESQAMRRLHLDDQGSLTIADIRTKAKAIPGLQLLVLDYLQLCSGSTGSNANRNAEIEQISRGLKALAKELGIAVIALSQLNRQVELRANKRPMLSDLRDSGSIEQDADAVMFLWPVREFSSGAKLVGLGIEKNRQGRTGEIALHFDGAMQTWGESTEPLHESAPAITRRRGMSDFD